MDEVCMPMKHVHYDRLLKPLIKQQLEDEQFGAFLNQGYNGWRLGATSQDMANVQFVEKLCGELMKSCESEFITMLGELVTASYDSHIRMSAASEIAASNRESDNAEERFAGMLDRHKTLFESEFRLWATIPYFFVAKVIKSKSKAETPESYVHVSASTKYYAIKKVSIALTHGHLPNLLGAIDVRVRNAGGGHDSWEILEDERMQMHFTDPYSGKRDGERTFTEEEFRRYFKDCEKAVWILEMGLNVFLVNNPSFFEKVQGTRKLKANEIRMKLDALVSERWIRVKDFVFNRQAKTATIVLERVKRAFMAERKEMYLSNGQKFVIIQKEIHSKYKRTILYALDILVTHLEPQEIPVTHIQVIDENGVNIADLTFSPEELHKLLGKVTEETTPAPSNGKWPETTFSRIIEFRVNPLFEKAMRKLFDDLPNNEDEWAAGIKKAQAGIAKYITL
ncbi:MAG: hypothetical protein PHW10_04520 [Candidatus Peribacteraceae bacterium]|nr:hypothetical protein [Candidatus Peribacteraceae bacterium]